MHNTEQLWRGGESVSARYKFLMFFKDFCFDASEIKKEGKKMQQLVLGKYLLHQTRWKLVKWTDHIEYMWLSLPVWPALSRLSWFLRGHTERMTDIDQLPALIPHDKVWSVCLSKAVVCPWIKPKDTKECECDRVCQLLKHTHIQSCYERSSW